MHKVIEKENIKPKELASIIDAESALLALTYTDVRFIQVLGKLHDKCQLLFYVGTKKILKPGIN